MNKRKHIEKIARENINLTYGRKTERERHEAGLYSFGQFTIKLHDDPSGTPLSRTRKQWVISANGKIKHTTNTLKDATQYCAELSLDKGGSE